MPRFFKDRDGWSVWWGNWLVFEYFKHDRYIRMDISW